ncbi:hypothetical protein [Tenacibaculum finnmarkense]|uniref:hypothetical protein n=1 Tax=Tenacibaculum finnmarkense TaxID=2781243 RepID=UPI001E559F2F|nr:hypothetical protein [Tenacibaculum finnmarkense]MCD8408849.1 hypothetical protein [Tenacibaculum finnmarkense genomovar ulcerans]
MKKTLLIICILIFNYGCSSSDDDPTSENSINPPSWIQGTWHDSDEDGIGGFKFTKDNFCQISGFSTISQEICYKELLEMSQGKTEEEATNDFYDIKIILSTGFTNQTFFHQFEKISNNEIKWYLSKKDDLYTIYTKQ